MHCGLDDLQLRYTVVAECMQHAVVTSTATLKL